MAMPEAPVNEDDFSCSSKNDVGLPWQVTGVQPVSVSEGMHQLAHEQFRSGVLRANPTHDFGPFAARKTVHSYSKSSVNLYAGKAQVHNMHLPTLLTHSAVRRQIWSMLNDWHERYNSDEPKT